MENDRTLEKKMLFCKIWNIEEKELLRRESVTLDREGIEETITGKIILVTGGGGSIGSELCRQIAEFKPEKLLIVDNYENNAYDIQQELKRKYRNTLALEVIIASIRDRVRMNKIFECYKPQIVFHAAAHKHVPLMEEHPTEAVKNNVFGTWNIAKLAKEYNAEKFVLISTDKAVNPANIMGATKRIAEMIVQSMNITEGTDFVAVRFGNVLGSNGSVIPLFKRQMAEGGPIRVTHPEITRYFMTIPEAAQLVLQAGSIAKGGEIFVLDMGEPVKIIELAERLISLAGLVPYVDIPIEFTGLRPGEKLYEELLMSEEGLKSTSHKKIFIGQPIEMDVAKLYAQLEELEKIIYEENDIGVKILLKQIVPTYVGQM